MGIFSKTPNFFRWTHYDALEKHENLFKDLCPLRRPNQTCDIDTQVFAPVIIYSLKYINYEEPPTHLLHPPHNQAKKKKILIFQSLNHVY